MDPSEVDLKIQSIIQELSRVLNNLKKSPHRSYRKQTLLEKLSYSKDLYRELERILIDYEYCIPDKILNFYIKGARLEFHEIKEIIALKLSSKQLSLTFETAVLVIVYINKLKNKALRKIVVMPTVDIKLGTALVNTYDGSPNQLKAFLDAVALFADTVEAEFENATAAQKAAAQVTVVRFVKTRLTGEARQAIGELNDLQQIVDEIKSRCASKITSDGIVAKLKVVMQNTTSKNFCAKINE